MKLLRLLSRRPRPQEIDPDEILLDATNLPALNESQFEGRFEKPVARSALILLGVAAALLTLAGLGKLWMLQVVAGGEYARLSENNRLRHSILFPARGVLYDRAGFSLVENEQGPEDEFPRRRYTDLPGLGHLLGFVSYPQKDRSGFYFQEASAGKDGAELVFDRELSGRPGLTLVETDAAGAIRSESVLEPPEEGENLTLSVDAEMTAALHRAIASVARDRGFQGGAGALMDVATGELLALTSFPEYRPGELSDGKDAELIASYTADRATPFLNRAVMGLYAPGSIVKPFVALGALDQNLIDPRATIVSTGELRVPNPYAPGQFSVFKDWRAHGVVDMRRALAVSSDVYFYVVGGGFGNQRGLGINNMDKYFGLFGLGDATGIDLPAEEDGVIPTPTWKEAYFPGDPWRVGDTYNTAIGQYGMQVTPLQMLRATAALANGGALLTPTVRKREVPASSTPVPIAAEHFTVVREGMRLAVTEGTAAGLAIPGMKIAAKTGTAQVGARNEYVNSWVIGFFPYEEPRYAFVVLMDRGPAANLVGAVSVARQFFDWLVSQKPEYAHGEAASAPSTAQGD